MITSLFKLRASIPPTVIWSCLLGYVFIYWAQTGKYVVRAEDLPRASKLPCAQEPMTRAEFEKYT